MARPEEGFTLTEVLVTVVITGIIAGAVTASIIIGLRTTDATVNRLSDSRDAQLAAAYFGTDVQGADKVLTSSATCSSEDSPVLDLVDETVASGDRRDVVSYVVRTRTEPAPRGEVKELRRVTCKVDGSTVVQEVNDLLLADDLDPSKPPVASVSAKQVELPVSVRGCSDVASWCRPGIDSQPYAYTLLGTVRAQ